MSFQLSKTLPFLFFDSFNKVISSNNVDNIFSTSSLEENFLTFQLILDNVVLNFDLLL